MRYAVFSDIHSNLEALETALGVLRRSHIDKFAFIGDVVGYGASPKECISILKDIENQQGLICIAGNHDWAVVDLINVDYFTEAARRAIIWTQDRLCDNEKSFLGGLKLTYAQRNLCFVHGTPYSPQDFDYMIDEFRAEKSFLCSDFTISFVGHSHHAGVFIKDSKSLKYTEKDFLSIEKGKRYIINDGSIGQPRDRDPRLCFCIYDQEASTVEFKRVEYDVASAQAKILNSGLPSVLADRLATGT